MEKLLKSIGPIAAAVREGGAMLILAVLVIGISYFAFGVLDSRLIDIHAQLTRIANGVERRNNFEYIKWDSTRPGGAPSYYGPTKPRREYE